MRESDFVEHCLEQTRSEAPSPLRRFMLAKILLFPCFVETFFYMQYFQYLTLTPEFTVRYRSVDSDPGGGQLAESLSDQVSISRAQFCEADSESVTSIGRNSGIETWYHQRSIVCDENFLTISSHMGLYLVLSIIAGTVLIVPMVDYHGRKSVNLVLGFLLILVLSLLSLSQVFEQMQSIILLAFLICLAVGLSAARAAVVLVYASELAVRESQGLILTFCFFCLGLKLLLSTVHEMHTEMSYMTAIYLNIAINTLTLPLQAWKLPESPHFLYVKQRNAEFFEALRMLSEFNTGSSNQIDIHALAEMEQSAETETSGYKPVSWQQNQDIEHALHYPGNSQDETSQLMQPKSRQETPLDSEQKNFDLDKEELPRKSKSLNRQSQSFFEESVDYFEAQQNLKHKSLILCIVLFAAIFSVTLTQATLRPTAHIAISIIDMTASLVFLLLFYIIKLPTLLRSAFLLQALLAGALMIWLWSTGEDFSKVVGFSTENHSLEYEELTSRETTFIATVLLVRISGVLALMASLWFALSEMNRNSAKRMGLILGVALGFAWASAYLATLTYSVLQTGAIGLVFVAASVALAAEAFIRGEDNAMSQYDKKELELSA